MFDPLWWYGRKFNPDQDRDELGRFAGDGGGVSVADLRTQATEFSAGRSDSYRDQASEFSEATGTKVTATEMQYLTASDVTGTPNDKLPTQSRPELSLAEQAAVYLYTGEDADITEPLIEAAEKAERFDAAIKVYRGIEVDDPDEYIEALKGDRAVEFTGVASTATSSGGSFDGNIQFVIRANRGLDLQPYGRNRGEMLLPASATFTL